MKVVGVISTTTLFLLLSTTLPLFAQGEHQGEAAKPAQHAQEAKPAQHEAQPKPAKQENQAKSARQEPQAKPAQHETQSRPAKQESEAKPAKQEQQQARNQQEQQHKTNQQRAQNNKQQTQARQVKQESQTRQENEAKSEQHNSNREQHAQRTPAEERRQRAEPALRLSARGNGRIPDERFHSNFGRGHEFRIGSPELVGGYSRFQYGGYSFGFIQPWPVGWYYTDDVYVDYIDGEYFLFNPYYPGVRLGINVII